MKQYILKYLTNADRATVLSFDFYADNKGDAVDHAQRLCRDNGWVFLNVQSK